MAERDSGSYDRGVLDTCAFIDVGLLEADVLPRRLLLTAVSVGELAQGVAMARSEIDRLARSERLAVALSQLPTLDYDSRAATRFGAFVGLVLEAGRDPRPRRLDLMIAATAAAAGLPLFTRNPDDFRGLEAVLHVVAV